MPTTATKKKRGTTEGQNHQTKNEIDTSTWAEPQSVKGQTPTTNHSHSEKKTNTPGRAEAPGSPEHQTTNTRHNHQKKDTPGRAEATGTKRGTPTAATRIKGQKTTAAANRNRSKTEEAKPANKKTKDTPGEQKPQRAKRQTPTTTANHNQQQTQTAADESPKARNTTQAATPNAKSNQTLGCANAALSLLHRLGRGDGRVLVGNKPLVPPPGSTPSHEISPSQIVQDPGGIHLRSRLLWWAALGAASVDGLTRTPTRDKSNDQL